MGKIDLKNKIVFKYFIILGGIKMAFELVKLNYAYDALEPVIDKETMEIHHSKHHQAYVNNLNNLIKDTVFEEASLEEILTHLEHAPEDKKNGIRNNIGGAFNHNLFWESMTPGGSKEPVGEIAKKIAEKFGDFETFKEEFNKKGAVLVPAIWRRFRSWRARVCRVVRRAAWIARSVRRRCRRSRGVRAGPAGRRRRFRGFWAGRRVRPRYLLLRGRGAASRVCAAASV